MQPAGNTRLRQGSFPKTLRILNRPDFVHLAETGKRVHGRFFLAVYGPGRKGTTRLGVTVTKRIGKAVYRNRIKRITREYFRLNRSDIAGSWDINIIAKQGVRDIGARLAAEDLESIFCRIPGEK